MICFSFSGLPLFFAVFSLAQPVLPVSEAALAALQACSHPGAPIYLTVLSGPWWPTELLNPRVRAGTLRDRGGSPHCGLGTREVAWCCGTSRTSTVPARLAHPASAARPAVAVQHGGAHTRSHRRERGSFRLSKPPGGRGDYPAKGSCCRRRPFCTHAGTERAGAGRRGEEGAARIPRAGRSAPAGAPAEHSEGLTACLQRAEAAPGPLPVQPRLRLERVLSSSRCWGQLWPVRICPHPEEPFARSGGAPALRPGCPPHLVLGTLLAAWARPALHAGAEEGGDCYIEASPDEAGWGIPLSGRS